MNSARPLDSLEPPFPTVTDWTTTPQPPSASAWSFPPSERWADDDLILVGGDLEPATLLAAYRNGIFPMEVGSTGLLGWWSPDPRGVVPLDQLRVTRSLRQSTKRFHVRVDTCFKDVIRACADPSREKGWITEPFIAAYTRLHEMGWAHSVEVFDGEDRLAGGLYGVRIRGLFAGESMFHRQRDASKVALLSLVNLMRESAMTLLDVQWRTDHLASLGAIDLPRTQYLKELTRAVAS